MIRGESIIYKSSDEAIPFKNDGGAVELLYSIEYLNTLQFLGFPPYELELKVGTPIMLLRNVNLQGGMFNGTRMIVKKMWSRLIEAQAITGNRMGEKKANFYVSFLLFFVNILSTAIMTVNCIFDLSPTTNNKNLEGRVYRKWIVKKPRRPAPIDYCCILIDREGNAIQGNMGKSDISYFNFVLLDGAAYIISKFMCTTTSNYQQTLDIETTLRFGRYTSFENIPAGAFPKHYFHFTSYNQLGTKIQRHDTTTAQRQPTLTDYIGCLIRVGDVQTFGNAGSNVTIVRKLDIENLNGDVVELTLWDEMAKGFNKREFEVMAGPVIFVVSSCKISEYNNRVQLLGTSATHYYFNPEIPELEDLQTRFAERFNLHPPLEISKIKFEDPAKEKNRNRYPLLTLLQQNPNNYRKSCSQCPRKIEDGDEPAVCPDYGPQPNLAYRNNFKAFVSDHSGTTTFTFFTPNADVLTGHECSELVKKYNMPSPRDFPTEILSIKGRQHIFQFHFNPYSETGKVDFYFDDILDKPL
ncbi:hypothetical protein OSB04_016160 [Centaurea solstitialis]|uniref:DNA helicase Pif1-like 2B domain-containing protein n=1 Tax=Centaurea solstitialis TaxID=347529 RepID=A0AA38TCA8_9ASTR|nr:hypothetical protein OSB04_016160 [Centaurea solstitialis]